MLDLCLLGCGGMMPLPRRHLTSLMARYNGTNILIDCGEGTQISIREKGWSFKQIDLICITHFHGDHIGGLPGLLLTMGNSDRTDPLTMVGPKGLKNVVDCLRVIAPELPFDINFIELEDQVQSLYFGDFNIEAFRVFHKVPCYGYNIVIERAGRFDAIRAKEQEIPLKFWSILQSGEEVEDDGKIYTPDMVLGEPRKGLKVTYCTDTRPVPIIEKMAQDADLFICEGMYAEDDKQEDAIAKRHMTFKEAANIAKKAQAERVWLTHYSPSLARPFDYIDEINKVYDRIEAGKDLKSITLKFEED